MMGRGSSGVEAIAKGLWRHPVGRPNTHLSKGESRRARDSVLGRGHGLELGGRGSSGHLSREGAGIAARTRMSPPLGGALPLCARAREFQAEPNVASIGIKALGVGGVSTI